jgi:hypothetical protein
MYPLGGYVLFQALLSLSVYSLVARRWAALLHHTFSTLRLCLTTGPQQWGQGPWTKTYETVSQNKFFFLLNHFSQVTVTKNLINTLRLNSSPFPISLPSESNQEKRNHINFKDNLRQKFNKYILGHQSRIEENWRNKMVTVESSYHRAGAQEEEVGIIRS